jgi:hypothetical protein
VQRRRRRRSHVPRTSSGLVSDRAIHAAMHTVNEDRPDKRSPRGNNRRQVRILHGRTRGPRPCRRDWTAVARKLHTHVVAGRRVFVVRRRTVDPAARSNPPTYNGEQVSACSGRPPFVAIAFVGSERVRHAENHDGRRLHAS